MERSGSRTHAESAARLGLAGALLVRLAWHDPATAVLIEMRDEWIAFPHSYLP
ncbi:hypothetical protein HHX38_24370 [Streptomyces sp. PKU-MA01144]|uniref:hypothetical protein n=1 Tax=Streptomyces sp. PKU-MA01144 TaxID=2729138 RepID=UPI00147FA575|nr:hypothetical protein [Streptomyces sp. PKU-MA01144]NNJ07240.1 hypothetical protein [Streptomyces sp. PKU-MA01144]